LAGNSNIAVPTEAAVKTYVDNKSLSSTFSSLNSTFNAANQLTGAINQGITYSEIAYNSDGYISSYKETVDGLTIKLITVTYDSDNLITAVTTAVV